MSKKEVRIYLNLNNNEENFIYTLLQHKSSASGYIKTLILKDHEKKDNNLIIANKLDLVIDAIKNLNTISILPTDNLTVDPDNKDFNLIDNFDDDY